MILPDKIDLLSLNLDEVIELNNDLHISLSKTLYLKYHQRDILINGLKKRLNSMTELKEIQISIKGKTKKSKLLNCVDSQEEENDIDVE